MDDDVASFYINQVRDVFMVLNGRAHSGLFKDWSDYQVPDRYPITGLFENFGTGDNVETDFQLTKSYVVGGQVYIRTIQKPDAGFVIRIDSTVQNDPADYTITATGLVQFVSAPAMSTNINWQGDYKIPFAFKEDDFNITMATFAAGSVPSTMIEQVMI
jgi:uncharacterized protein (TIGR02217 family)